MIHAFLVLDDKAFKIKTFQEKHSCYWKTESRLDNAEWISVKMGEWFKSHVNSKIR